MWRSRKPGPRVGLCKRTLLRYQYCAVYFLTAAMMKVNRHWSNHCNNLFKEKNLSILLMLGDVVCQMDDLEKLGVRTGCRYILPGTVAIFLAGAPLVKVRKFRFLPKIFFIPNMARHATITIDFNQILQNWEGKIIWQKNNLLQPMDNPSLTIKTL